MISRRMLRAAQLRGRAPSRREQSLSGVSRRPIRRPLGGRVFTAPSFPGAAPPAIECEPSGLAQRPAPIPIPTLRPSALPLRTLRSMPLDAALPRCVICG